MAYSIGTRPLAVVVVGCALVATTSAPAFAQTPTRQGVAQTTFDEARVLFDRGAYDAACEKFKASQELDPKGGTLLNLALCREKQGRIASAWTAFSEAKNLSLKEGRDERVAFAEGKLRELERRVPRIRLVVSPAARVPDLEVRVDGEVLLPVVWNSAMPLDPGPHRLEASAPGYVSFATSMTAAPGKVEDVALPVLARERSAEPPAPPAPTAEPPTRWPGWAVAGLGAASIGVGAVFGVRAFDQRKDAEALCAAARCDEGRTLNDDGVRSAWISNVAIGAGVIAVVAGVYLLARPTSAPKTTLATALTF